MISYSRFFGVLRKETNRAFWAERIKALSKHFLSTGPVFCKRDVSIVKIKVKVRQRRTAGRKMIAADVGSKARVGSSYRFVEAVGVFFSDSGSSLDR